MADRNMRGGGFSKIWGWFVALFLPKTPRGKVRRAFAFILLLLFFAGTYAYPAYWNNTITRVDNYADAASWPAWARIPHFLEQNYHLGLDLQGGAHLVYKADMSSIPAAQQADAMAGVRDVIERRVNAFGVSEPNVQTNRSGNEWRLIVDLAGITDINKAIKLIGETPILEFKEENNQPAQTALTSDQQAKMDAYNKDAKSRADDALKQATAPGADFGALASKLSEDDATKSKGGDLGLVGPDGAYASLYAAVQKKTPAEGHVLDQVVQDASGYHVVEYDGTQPGPDEIKASHILICYKGAQGCSSDRTQADAKSLADKLQAQATAANFAILAKANSDDSGTASKGGDLGWFGKGVMVAPFEKAAFALKKGQISDVVESPFGYHIIYKTGERATTDYHLKQILIKTKSASDYLPPASPWKNTQLSGKDLQRATVQFAAQTNEPEVALQFNSEGKQLFADITKRNVGKPVAIFLDGQPISTPTVNEAITGGSAVITGNFSIQEAKTLAQRLNAGALPVPITLESQTSVGATLGNDSLTASLRAGLIGFIVVGLFMLLYYRLPGLIAIFALGLYTALNLAVYKLFKITLSLSGIAGFILSVGMAVDANVLIFERMKEELQRGRTLGSAIDEGFKRAWTSIRDSNFTTLISSTVLFYTSSSLIKGFALTLGIGVLLSMFSAITVSRTLLRLVSGWKIFHNEWLYLPALHKLKKPASEEDDNDGNE